MVFVLYKDGQAVGMTSLVRYALYETPEDIDRVEAHETWPPTRDSMNLLNYEIEGLPDNVRDITIGEFLKYRRQAVMYRTSKWKRLRAKILARDGYECQESRRYGKHVPASVVHHVFPVDKYPQYRWEAWNLISLSASVHDEMHDRTTGQLTDKGKALMERTARKYGISIRKDGDDEGGH